MKFFLLISLIIISGCYKKDEYPDYALVKYNDMKYHSATFHDFVDNEHVCNKTADDLNQDDCVETDGKNCLNPFSCKKMQE